MQSYPEDNGTYGGTDIANVFDGMPQIKELGFRLSFIPH
jgi:hypothetical protein